MGGKSITLSLKIHPFMRSKLSYPVSLMSVWNPLVLVSVISRGCVARDLPSPPAYSLYPLESGCQSVGYCHLGYSHSVLSGNLRILSNKLGIGIHYWVWVSDWWDLTMAVFQTVGLAEEIEHWLYLNQWVSLTRFNPGCIWTSVCGWGD